MFYKRSEARKIQRYLLLASLAAWATIVAPALWAGPEPVAIMCGSSWIPGSTVDWMLSASVGWLLMVGAMMTPLSLPPLLHIRISSFSDRRRRSTSLFLIGYVAIWLIAGLATKALALALSRAIPDASLQVGATALMAFLWQVSPFKQRCLNQCHAHRSLCAFGRGADIDAFRFGLEHGVWCVASCWALMWFADGLTQWHLTGMALVALLMYCERMDPPMSPAWKLRGFRTALLHLRHAVFVHRPSRLSPPLKPLQ